VALTYSIDDAAHTLRVRGEGMLDVAHCDAVTRAVAAELSSRPGWPILADVRELTWVPWPNEVRQVAMVIMEMRAAYTGPIAIVVARPVVFGLARMLSTLVEPVGVRMMPFWSVEDAASWCAQQSPSATTSPAS
jgi:hypothetical protein